jgi:hypothetical protein
MRAIGGRIDEFRLVDDAVDLLVLAHEIQIGELPSLSAASWSGAATMARRHEIAHLARKIAHQRLKIASLLSK